ncbi:hypothetical protein X943_003685 [Babesia divergens]|uniref:Uncharacterized protein n=1 Tax=Babesia divergens TaxID=32595 RepID=A0AAD9LHE0_BABDI|nr:hypothetical protein X943_003685 [Babesia divergens]
MANTIFRGELYLTSAELESFRKRLEQLCAATLGEDAAVNVPWQLAPVDASAVRSIGMHQEPLDIGASLPPRRERSNNRPIRMNANESQTTVDVPGHSTIDDDIDSLFKEIMDEDEDFDEIELPIAPQPNIFPQQYETVEYEDQSPIYCLLNPAEGTFSNMPSWAQKFHAVISSLCRTKSGSMFLTPFKKNQEHTDVSPENKVQTEPELSLQTVLENFLNNKYTSTTEAFSDVYMTIIDGFNTQVPGTEPWMTAQDACSKLEGLRRESGLVDSEIAHVAGFGGKHPPATQPPSLARQLPVNLDFVSEIQPISNQEKVHFQETLATLSAECHLELYIAFEYLAVWRNVGNGEIELDDEATNPNVFRYVLCCNETTST